MICNPKAFACKVIPPYPIVIKTAALFSNIHLATVTMDYVLHIQYYGHTDTLLTFNFIFQNLNVRLQIFLVLICGYFTVKFLKIIFYEHGLLLVQTILLGL